MGEEEKIVITPKVLPVKAAPEEEEESEEEEVKPEPKKKLSKADLKPSVQIKVAAAPEEIPKRRKKEEQSKEEEGSLFDNVPEIKPKVKDEFLEKDKKPKEEEKIVITPKVLPEKAAPEEEEESEEEVKPEPNKKLSKADLKPSVQIKIAAAPE